MFLLSRITECHDKGADSDTAVGQELQRSCHIITSAAALVMIVFLGFAAGSSLGIKEMGLALAIAVYATLVRCLLVPATMTLLGNANWWAPAPLRGYISGSGCAKRPQPNRPSRIGPNRHPSRSTGSDRPVPIHRLVGVRVNV